MDSQLNLQNIITLCEMSKVDIIYVSIIQKDKAVNIVDQVDLLNIDHNFTTKRNVDLPIVIDEPGLEPIFANMPLLSDGWADLLNRGVGCHIRGGAEDYRIALIKYAFKNGFSFKYARNTSDRVVVVCREQKKCGCKWHIKAKFDSTTDSFAVYQAELSHTCVSVLVKGTSHKIMCYRLMGQLLTPNAKMNPAIGAANVIHIMKLGYGVEVPYWKARRATKISREFLFGTFEKSYDKLRHWCEALTSTNPGSVAIFESDPNTKCFQRVFISFKACIDGLKYCPPILFLDGTFLRGYSKGNLLIVVAKDANSGLFPVSMDVVSAENLVNWQWFLCSLRDNIIHDRNICFISDRNSGLLAVLPLVFERPKHFYCLYHLLTNLKGKINKKFSKEIRHKLVKMFKECAYAPNKANFEVKCKKFIDVGGSVAQEWLSQLPNEKWALSYSTNISRYGDMTSNAAESFNVWLSVARAKPITQIFKHIRFRLSRWFVERRASSQK